MSSRPLWAPDPDQAAQTNLARFAAGVGIDVGADGGYERLHRWSVEDLGGFWSAVWDFCGVVASERGSAGVVEAEHMSDVRFFDGARLNFAENLLAGDDAETAMVFANEAGDYSETSRGELRALVSRLAGAMRAQGVGPGDRVVCWMPNVVEAYAVMLAAASIGAVFSSTSPDFGTAGVLDRFGQIEPVILIAVDGYSYGGQRFDCRERLAEIRAGLPTVGVTVVLNRTGLDDPPSGTVDFDAWIESHPAGPIQFEQLPFDHPLYVLYSSGTTGRPKCIVHRAGGILLKHLCEHQLHCDVRPGDRVFYFTTTGWMMWNWLASAPASGAAAVVWDGNPVHPHPDTLFDLADRAGVTLFGTSARYIDSLRKAGVSPRRTHSLGALRTICSTGSPLSPGAFGYIYNQVKDDVHLASISGGTDLCGCLVAGDPTGPVWSGEIQRPALGLDIQVLDGDGSPLGRGQFGELVCASPFPSQPLRFWGKGGDERYRAAYYGRFEGRWHQGDYICATEHGGFVISGRSDATLNPGGVRIGTAEIYRLVDAMDEVVESVVVGQPVDGDTPAAGEEGEAPVGGDTRVVLFVKLADGVVLDDDLEAAIRAEIRAGATPRHVPEVIGAVDDIPRTRSGKTVELAVRDAICGRPIANLEALANPEALDQFRTNDNRPAGPGAA
ncbi:acetoacetate--CoA ligase [Candidatus Poriferisocius sp.]|uniref:acetoacetate--CoA ligase n=1 Tax=Candidatus Poriferisocius sp. TaxID=3101276 RepID=UPI003B021C4B